MGSGWPRLKSQWRLTQMMRRSVGWSRLGFSSKELALNFVPHQGSLRAGSATALRSLFLKAMVLAPCRAGILVSLVAHAVRRGRLADPQADLERPVAELLRVLLALQLQGADQRRCAAELVERQQPERVPHEDA